MKKLLVSLTVLIVAGFSLSSCNKETKAPDPGFDVQGIGANATILIETPLDLYLQVDRAIRLQRDSIIARNINQPTYTFKMGYISLTVSPADTTTYPKTILLDFGADTKKAYQGKMSIKVNGNMKNTGSNCAISYLNLVTYGSTLTGNDSVFSFGKNTGGSIVTRYNIHGGHVNGLNSNNLTYDGRVIANFNLSNGTNVIDSVEINGTDANLVTYKLYSVPTYKLQIIKGCPFFNTGVIGSDIKKNSALTANLVYDFGYSSMGNFDACDADGAVYIYSRVNTNYQQQFAFQPFLFE